MKLIKAHKFITACVLVAIIVVILSLCTMFRRTEQDYEEQAQSIKETIYARAVQCYVIEGAYPESLEYLEENYGLTVNREDFLVVYTPFADNLPPQIRVKHRKGGK